MDSIAGLACSMRPEVSLIKIPSVMLSRIARACSFSASNEVICFLAFYFCGRAISKMQQDIAVNVFF